MKPNLRQPLGVVLLSTLAVLLSGVASPAVAQYFGKNRIQYRDFDWKIYRSPHFDVHYYEAEEALLEKTVSFAESAYDELSRVFDYQIQEPTPLIVYATHSAFLQTNVIINGVPEGAQAFATPSRFRMVLPLDLPDAELLALIKHELVHIFQYHILFRGRLGAGLRSRPPTWFIEGMASYFADDEQTSDRKFMVDAVVNDNIPSVGINFGGYFAYRFGHAVFDFIEERWGADSILDFIYEYRNTVGSRISRAIERTFRMDVEDFDAEFRRWLRQRYLQRLLETGEPGDFGRPFRLEENRQGQEASPVAAPSGDLVAAITTDKGEIDISLFDAQKRRRIRNLTKGLDREIREIVSQFFSTGRGVGSDLAFSPDGNYIAAFGRREAGRSLLLFDVLRGGLVKIIDMEIEQQLSPAFSPDGRTVAFSGNLNGQFDIFTVDLESYEIRNLTNDEMFDAAPAYSPDGRSMAYTSFVGETAQLFRLDLQDPEKRYQLTEGDANNKEPVYSPSGDRIYFTSDRSGADNIYGLDLGRKEIYKFTNAVTGCDQPTVLALPEGGERLVYTGYWKGRFDLFMTDVEEPIGDPEPVSLTDEPTEMAALERFEPDIEVTLDDGNYDNYRPRKFFLEDIQNFIGLDSNQIFVGSVLLSFTDYLGDRRILGRLSAVETFSDFDISYVNLKNRWQWVARVFDNRFYAPFLRREGENLVRDRDEYFSQTGAEFRMIYPLSFNNRVELSGSYRIREFEGSLFVNANTGVLGDCDLLLGQIIPELRCAPIITPREDDFPQVEAAFVSDSTLFNAWGPVAGHRVRLGATYAPDFDDGGTLTSTITLDARQYFPLTRRSNFAFRLFGRTTTGNVPDVSFIGGLDTLRGIEFRDISGTRAFYANIEFRFPLIDQLAFAGGSFGFSGIRGIFFFDIGAAYYHDVVDLDFYDSDEGELRDAIASYGWGISTRLLGVSVNWDVARLTRFADDEDFGFETNFWIGTRF